MTISLIRRIVIDTIKKKKRPSLLYRFHSSERIKTGSAQMSKQPQQNARSIVQTTFGIFPFLEQKLFSQPFKNFLGKTATLYKCIKMLRFT